MSDLPSISVVVPNFNGGETIATTLQSLVDQQYPKLELIVIDGGSTDDSVEIIRRFEPHLAYWVSEKDRGQSHAINKGFARATGEIVNWLCSDDLLLPGALQHIGEHFAGHPETDVLAGACRYMYLYMESPEYLHRPTPAVLPILPAINAIGQPAVYYRRSILDRPGPLREDLHYTMDLELFCHFLASGRRFAFTDQLLAQANEDGRNKTASGGQKIIVEMKQIYRQYAGNALPWWWERVHLPLRRVMEKSPSPAARLIARYLRKIATGVMGVRYGFGRLRAMENWYGSYEGGLARNGKAGPQ